MHGRVVGELGGDERVVSSVWEVMDASKWKKTPSALAAICTYLILANSTYVYLMLCTTTRLLHGIADQPTCS